MSVSKKRKLSSKQNEKIFEEIITENRLPELLSRYSATLSREDQKLLRILRISDHEGNVNFAKFFPLIWGPESAEKYANLKKLGTSLWNRPTENEVLDLFDDQKLWLTALRFPLNLPWDISTKIEESFINSELYDPRFCLTVFSNILAPHCPINCRKFVEKSCLALTFACLSSRTEEIRSLAILTLSRFVFHLKSLQNQPEDSPDNFDQKSQFVYIVMFLKNSLETANRRLPCIITHFLMRVCRLFLNPEDPLYAPLNAFLLLKPSLDLENVPEFYKLFHSSSSENYRRERHWMLYLLADGLREARDYHLLEKRYGMKLLLSFFDCSLADEKSRELILRIVKSAVDIPTAATDLCRKHNLIGWLANCAGFQPIKSEKEAGLRMEIFESLWKSISEEKHEDVLEKDAGKSRKKMPELFLSSLLICCDCLMAESSAEVLTSIRTAILERC